MMRLWTRRELLRAGALTAGALALPPWVRVLAGGEAGFGSPLFPALEINAAELDAGRLDCLWAFVKSAERNLVELQALSPEPQLMLRAPNSGGGVFKIRLANVHGLDIQLQGAEVLDRSLGQVTFMAEVGPGGRTLVQTALPRPEGPVRFLCTSDTHLGVPETERKFLRVLDEINRRDAVFWLNVGDNVDEDNSFQWKRFQELVERARIPVFTTTGNHDSYFSDQRYLLNRGNLFYGFAYADALFLLMNNTQRYNKGTLHMSTGPREAQWEWLPRALEREARHKFAAMHFPAYGQRSMAVDMYLMGDSRAAREAEVGRMLELFGDHGLDYLLYGHVHNPMRETVDGIVHLRLGGGGGALQSFTPEHEVSVTHVFMDEKGIRDYFVYLFAPETGLEELRFLEAPEQVRAGADFRPTAVGVAAGKLYGAAVELEAGTDNIEALDRDGFKASAPGPAVIRARHQGLSEEWRFLIV